VDNTCDAVIDEGFDVGAACTVVVGSCQTPGTKVCTADHAGTVCQATEVCDGLDNNCDGTADEGGGALCADGNDCTDDVCGGTSGCLNPPVADGSCCNDGDACTQSDSCQAGVCAGASPVVCAAFDQCHLAGTCDPGSGNCSNPIQPNGTPCDDQVACTLSDACQAGVCRGTPQDVDGDGQGDSLCGGTDCADANPFVWSAPVQVTGLTVATASPANLAWASQGTLVGPETTYDLVSGTLSSDPVASFTSGACMQSGGGPSFIDSRPDPATAFWYLARARNSCGVGTYGTLQRDTNIPPCP
jgi:hypothetical protein